MTIAEKLKQINLLYSQINQFSPNKDWDATYLETVKIQFTYASNNIEGNTLTLGQTFQLLKQFITPKNASSRDILDIVNHKKVLDIIFENYQSKEITEESIKKLHKELMKGWEQWSDSTYYDPGKYKIFENMTQRSTGKIHYYSQPEDVPTQMAELIQRTNHLLSNADLNNLEKHPLHTATYFHQEFLNKIHPFGDGNGRIGRIFMNLILLKSGFSPIFIGEINRRGYLLCFEQEDEKPGTMLSFMADQLINSLESKLNYLKGNGV